MKKPMLFLIVALASLMIPLPDVAAQISSRNKEFADLVTTYQNELKTISEYVREITTLHSEKRLDIIKGVETKRQKHFQAWQRAMQKNMSERAGVELMFSKKYKELFEKTVNQILENGKKFLGHKKYEEAIICFKDILRVKSDHEAASLSLCQAYFYQGCDLFENGADEGEARAKIRQYHQHRKEFRDCGTYGREQKAAYCEKGKKLCKEGSEEMNSQKRREGLRVLTWLQYIDPNYRGDDVRAMITRCGNVSDCKEKLRAAIEMFKGGDTEAADLEMAEIRQKNSQSCNAFITSKADALYSEGLNSFSGYKFDQTVSFMNLARFVSPAEYQQNTAPYIKISELIIKARNLFDQQNNEAAITAFEQAKRLHTGNEDAHIGYAQSYIDLANRKRYEKRLKEAVMLCENYLKSEFSYEGYLKVKSAFEVVCKDPSATPECFEYIKNFDLKYLEYHYAAGVRLFKADQLREALSHFKAVRKIDPDYEEVESYIRVIENEMN